MMSIMSSFVYLLLVVHQTQSTFNYSSWITPSSPKLPRQTQWAHIGKSSNNTIWIIGGWNGGTTYQQLVSFKNNIFYDYGEFYLGSPNFYGLGQSYTQYGSWVYMVYHTGDKFSRFNVDTMELKYNYQSIRINPIVNQRSCLTHIEFDNGYLAVIGGWNLTHSMDTVQVLNLTDFSWIQTISPLNIMRLDSGCIVLNNVMYVVGGSQPGVKLDSIEIWNVYDVSNLHNEQWHLLNDTLSQGMYGLRLVIWGNEILQIGGRGSITEFVYDINVIDTTTNTVYLGGHLDIGIGHLTPIVIGNVLYAFGGDYTLAAPMVDTYRYKVLPPTQEPTPSPTIPTLDPTVSPSFSPTVYTNSPTNAPSVSPSTMPTMAPSTIPSTAPTVIPTNAPTISPSNAPTHATLHPSLTPTLTPSLTPTFAPSIAPTDYPSQSPSYSPTMPPTNVPTESPTNAPSNAPSFSPSSNPSESPTTAPTRLPTVSNWYSVWIDVVYGITNYNINNIYFILNNTKSFVEYVQETLQRHYFTFLLSNEQFAVKITEINEVPFRKSPLSFDDLKSYQLEDPIVLNAKIFVSDADYAGFLKTKVADDGFITYVEHDFREYLHNNKITFEVLNADSLHVSSEVKIEAQPIDFTIAYISIIIVGIGIGIGLYALYYNRKQDSKVDNSLYLSVILMALQIYDLISDINLINDIFMNDDTNELFWCGISSIAFTVIPFVANVCYAITIPSQEVIKDNNVAKVYFDKHLKEFVIFVVITGGCFPALCLVSSRVFAWDLLNCGLTNYELNKLVKIKIFSTVILENTPQLLIQVIYTVLTGTPTTATVFAFTASLLSIIATLVTYYAQRIIRKSDSGSVVQYAIDFILKDEILDEDEKTLIKERKERKKALGRMISEEYEILFESLEIGYVNIKSAGCTIHMVQHVFAKKLKAKMNGVNVSIDPNDYMKQLCRSHADAIRDILCEHFGLGNTNRFVVKYCDDGKEMTEIVSLKEQIQINTLK